MMLILAYGVNLIQETLSKREFVDTRLVLQQFVEEHQSMIYNVCFRLLGNQQDAEDIAQDVFVKAYEKYGLFKGESRVSTWLYRIAVNLSLNLLKRRKRVRWMTLDFEKEDTEALPIHEPRSVEQPDLELEQSELGLTLQEAIQSLPEKQKTAFILHKLEGLSHQQISEILDISISSVEARIHRAKQSLRKKLVHLYKN
jgi:RNA polymerase sigma-70 factor (ECF subfamily)